MTDPRAERRQPRPVSTRVRSPRTDVARYISKHRLENFYEALNGLAVGMFGDGATAMAHLRTVGGQRRLTFVVDAADPSAGIEYEQFLPRERAFWTAYALLAKPNVPFVVAIRPARGWCRMEALAPLFSLMPVADLDA